MPQQTQVPVDRPVEQPYPPLAVSWYATIILAFLYWLSILDRFIISLLVDPIKEDMEISDVQFGLLHGIGFSVTFCLLGLIAGTFADRYSRRKVIYLCVTIWSMATALCGLAHHFWQLLLARVGVGVGEAGLNPSATSMLTDLFPRHHLTKAMAVYAMGSTVGSGTAYLVGGLIVEWVSHIDVFTFPLIGEIRAWQIVFFIIGVPGIFLALLIFTVPEPVRRHRNITVLQGGMWKSGINTYIELWKFMRSRLRFFLPLYVGFGLASMLVSSGGLWYPAHMSRTYNMTPSEIGLYLGVTLMTVGIVGKLVCGYCVDAIYRRGNRDAQLLWYACCLVLASPIAMVTMSSDSPWVFTLGVGAFMLLLSPMAACCYAAMNLVTPNELRGTGVALFSASAGLIAVSVGPVLIAWVGNTFFPGPSSLGMGLAVVFGLTCPIAAIILLNGRRAMREAVLESEEQYDGA